MQNIRSMPKYATPKPSSTVKTHRKARLTALWVALGALIVIIPLMIISGTIIFFQVNEFNIPGVFIFDRDVGMINRDETLALVDGIWNRDLKILLAAADNPGSGYWLSPRDLGYWIDPAATAKAAYNVGRGADPLLDITSALQGELKVIQPVIYFDEDAARRTLETLAQELSLAPKDAAVVYQDGGWSAIPGSEGRTVDINATLDHLYQDAFTNLISQSVTLYMKSVPPALSDLTSVLDDIDSVVAQELPISAYDPITDETLSWAVPIETKRTWVTIDPETYEVSLAFNQDEITALINTWEAEMGGERSLSALPDSDEIYAAWENNETVHTAILHNPTTYQVAAGESLWSISLELGIPLWYIMDANPGLTTSNLEAGMTLTIPSKNILLPLPVVPDKRIVIDISEQRMTVYENGQVRNTHIISTGVSDSPTMAGFFQVQTHELNAYASNWDLYMPHFMGIYEAWPGFMNGIHGLPLLSSGSRLWASTLGTPVSYGCIILDLAAAEDLYNWADPGVVVEIRR